MDLKERLEKRLKSKPDEIEKITDLLERYDIKLTIRNFDSQGLVLTDLKGKSVRICFGDYRGKMIHVQDPKTDIAIVFAGGILCGWIESEKLEDITDRMLVDVKSLHKMPDDFLFIQQCPHLEIHGGFFDGSVWECARCKERLVFNDS